MERRPLQARFIDFDLPASTKSRDATVAIPVSNGMQQRYFFMNLKTRKGLTIRYPKRSGLTTRDAWAFLEHLCSFAMNHNHRFFPRLRTLLRKYHNGISFLEILFKVSKPHGITHVGDQRYLVSLWSSSTYFVIDLRNRSIELHMLSKKRNEVFSTYQFFDDQSNETYFATQEGVDEFYKHDAEDTKFVVPILIKKYNWTTDDVKEIWRGGFDTDTHYIALNKDRRYLGLVQLGDFFADEDKDKEEKNLLPSKILILDLITRKEWWIDNSGWSPSAHIDWDPVDPDVCYLSCHRGVILPVRSVTRFFFQKIYRWKIYGPASVHKFAMTAEGPRKVGVFTHPELFRLTIHKVFVHREQKLMACTGFPHWVFLADANSMDFVGKIELREKCGKRATVGSLYPLPDGEKICVVTTQSLQIIDVASRKVELVHDLGTIYDPFNHMTCVGNADW